jgi:membrane protein
VLPGGEALWHIVELGVSFGFVTLLFALIYKVLPAVELAWRDVWVGAGMTALLFTVGKFLIGLYLGRSGVSSAYGAAGSLVLVLVWVYYSGLIFFFGAEFTQVYANTYGRGVKPDKDAMRVEDHSERPKKRAHWDEEPRAQPPQVAADSAVHPMSEHRGSTHRRLGPP